MYELTRHEGAFLLPVMQATGEYLHVTLPGVAESDATFLKTWLYGKSEKTQQAYSAEIKKLYRHVGKSLAQVTLADVQNFLNSLLHLKPTSQARATAAIKSVLSFGLKTGYLSVNVGSVVKLPKLEDTLAERILSESQVAKIFALETNPRNHAILILLYRAGLRAAELCNLAWHNLQERNDPNYPGQVTVFGKGKKTRTILLDVSTWQEVMQLHTTFDTPDSYVFQSRQERSRANKKSRRLDESMIHRIVRAAAKRAGIVGWEHISPHWFRHAHASHALERNAPITLVKETLGHSSLATTNKYAHARPNASSTQFLGV